MEKKILTGATIFFFSVMLVFTFVSRHTSVSMLPEVNITFMDNDGAVDYGAVGYDEAGRPFVFVLIEEDSILGHVTVAHRTYIEVRGAEDGEILTGGLRGMDHMPLAAEIFPDLDDGERVRIKGNG